MLISVTEQDRLRLLGEQWSGDKLYQTKDQIFKITDKGQTRIRYLHAQANRMTYFNALSGNTVCPKIIGLTNNGYRMIYHMPITFPEMKLYAARMIKENVRILQTYLWDNEKAVYEENYLWKQAIAEYIKFIAYTYLKCDPDKLKKRFSTFENIRPRKAAFTIHGDPTLSNMVWNKSAQAYLMIDPLPANPCIPNQWHVDAGKIAQSIFGWEHMLLGQDEDSFIPLLTVLFDEVNATKPDIELILCWARFHFLRLFSYLPPDNLALKAKIEQRIFMTHDVF